ncbi:unnamed protein product [Parajaminaea phylloscopi]
MEPPANGRASGPQQHGPHRTKKQSSRHRHGHATPAGRDTRSSPERTHHSPPPVEEHAAASTSSTSQTSRKRKRAASRADQTHPSQPGESASGSARQLGHSPPPDKQKTKMHLVVPALRGARAAVMAQDRAADAGQARVVAGNSHAPTDDDVDVASPATTSRLKAQLAAAIEARDASDAEVLRLIKEKASKNDLLEAQRSALTYIYDQASCHICLDLAWRPHALTPCGHIFCITCLLSWFTQPLQDEIPISRDLSGDTDEAHRRALIVANHRRKKVCPQCRTSVTTPPTELFAVKGIIRRLHDNQTLADASAHDGNEPRRSAVEEEEHRCKMVPPKPWDDIFDPAPATKIFDAADDCYRCSTCLGEVVWGECQNCGQAFSSNGADDDDDHDQFDGGLAHYFDSEAEASDDDDDDDDDSAHDGSRANLSTALADSPSDEGGSEMDGFIIDDDDDDDEDDNGEVVDDDEDSGSDSMLSDPSHARRRRRGYSEDDNDSSMDDHSAEDDEGDDSDEPRLSRDASSEEIYELAAPSAFRSHRPSGRPPPQYAVSDDDAEPPGYPGPSSRSGVRRSMAIVVGDSDDEESVRRQSSFSGTSDDGQE